MICVTNDETFFKRLHRHDRNKEYVVTFYKESLIQINFAREFSQFPFR